MKETAIKFDVVFIDDVILIRCLCMGSLEHTDTILNKLNFGNLSS